MGAGDAKSAGRATARRAGGVSGGSPRRKRGGAGAIAYAGNNFSPYFCNMPPEPSQCLPSQPNPHGKGVAPPNKSMFSWAQLSPLGKLPSHLWGKQPASPHQLPSIPLTWKPVTPQPQGWSCQGWLPNEDWLTKPPYHFPSPFLVELPAVFCPWTVSLL